MRALAGVWLGCRITPTPKRAHNQGEAVTLVVRLRNVGKEAVKFQYNWAFFVDNQPAVTDGEGKRVLGKSTYMGGAPRFPVEVNLAPGKEIDLYESNLELKPGKFQIQYERVFGSCAGAVQVKLDPTLSKLATGKLELEIKSDPPPGATEKKSPLKQEREKESFTAWGKEAGGLQGGLGFRRGEHRVCHHGETVKIVVRVRNVGKEVVKFQYLRKFFVERPPAVTDDEGKPVTLPGVTTFGIHIPEEVNLASGMEIELYELGPSGISVGDACSVNRVFAGLHACFVGQSSGPGYRSKPPQWK